MTGRTSRRPSIQLDKKSILIRVDVEGSNHANLKKAQYVNQVKEVYNAETKYVVPVYVDHDGSLPPAAKHREN